MAENPHLPTLHATAASLCREGKGILAADESVSTIGKRLTSYGLKNDEETRRAFREILICAPGNEEAYSGIILFHETLYQSDSSGRPFVETLQEKGIHVGVKVDTGLRALGDAWEGETHTCGLDTLAARCGEYYSRGARFAKWRAALRVDGDRGQPSDHAIASNARELAEYAATAQRCGLVAIVEPEILMDGGHGAGASAAAAGRVLAAVYDALAARGVALGATLLKPMMVVGGVSSGGGRAGAAEVADATLRVLRARVPAAVPGVMFLSGGMGEAQATRNLAEINRRRGQAPWRLSFSFGRALQTSVLETWLGRAEKKAEAMRVAAELGRVNAKATMGVYEGHPSEGGKALYEGFRGWRGGEDTKGI